MKATRACSIPGCDREHYCKDMCQRHYQAAWVKERPSFDCSAEGCEKPQKSSGWCAMHVYRLLKHGTTATPIRRIRPVEERFWEKVAVKSPGECWLWLAAVGNVEHNDGYGRFGVTSRHIVLAHRMSYELSIGPIPNGLTLDHLCMVRACVNPAHLEPVTMAENNARAAAHKRKGG